MKKLYGVLICCFLALFGCSGGGGGGSSVSSPANRTLASIEVTPANNVLAVGMQKQFTATGAYSNGEKADLTASVAWSSSDSTSVSVSNDPATRGMVKILGQTTRPVEITAKLGSISGTSRLTVSSRELVAVGVTPSSGSVAAGTSSGFTAIATYSDATIEDVTQAAQWSSSLPAVATVTGGRVSAAAAGSATITALFNGKSGTATVTVTNATLTSLAIAPQNYRLSVGTSGQLSASGTFSDGSTQDLTAGVAWSSSSPGVATVSVTGRASGVATGTTTITAVHGTITATATVNVTAAALQSLTITPGTLTLVAGETRPLTATGSYSDGTTQDLSRVVTWNSSSPSTAIITGDGTLAAAETGNATISATYSGVSASAALTITPLDVTGTWTGTYTIYDDPDDPSQIGTYTFRFELVQRDGVLSGVPTLRDIASGQLSGSVSGRNISFQYTYFSPLYSRLMENIGTVEITDNVMSGHAVENYNSGYNCSYVFTLRKTP